MADDKTPDPEEQKAEAHVKEIMGPPQVDGADESMESGADQTAAEAPHAEEAESELPDADSPAPEETPAEPITTPEVNETEQAAEEAAVDDITRSEADAALPEEDLGEAPVVMKESRWGRLKDALYNWWDSPWKRYGTLAGIVIVLGIVFGIPAIRAGALNLVGVRSSVQVVAIDGSTNLPLQNVKVTANGAGAKTDANGKVTLKGVKLGSQDVVLAKAGFATTTRHISLGLRVQDLGDVTMKAVGTQYTLKFTDYLSGKPVADVAVSSGEATSKSDKTGKAVLTVPPSDSTVQITANGDSYRTETINAPSNPSDVINVALVPAAKEIFVSKASGTYDVYKIDADGKNKAVLLKGTGLETMNISLSVSTNSDYVAVVSTRDDKRNSDGYLLNTLSIVKISDGSDQTVDHSEQFVLIGWRNGSLIYQQTTAGASAANPSRQKIFAYEVATGKRYQLANANYFSGSVLYGTKLYYVVSSTDPSTPGGLASVNLDGTGKKTLMTGNVWSFVRTAYDKVLMQTSDNTWHQYTFGDSSAKDSVAPSSYASRNYVDSADGKQALWVDVRDTTGVVFLRNNSDGTEKQLFSQRNAQYIVRWLSPTAFVVRTSSPSQTADYAASINGGDPKLITEVSPVQGY